MKKKRILLITLIFALLICFFLPKEKSVKKKIKNISYEHPEYKERYNLYKSKHPHLTKEEIVTLVNMNRDYDFYDHIIKQEHPNDLNTIVNKYYQLDENYAPDDLVEINNRAKKYGLLYSKHTARKVLYDDFIALQEACYQKGFELYVTSG